MQKTRGGFSWGKGAGHADKVLTRPESVGLVGYGPQNVAKTLGNDVKPIGNVFFGRPHAAEAQPTPSEL